MFFVREQRVKIIGILLLLNVSWSLAELPASSYLPPNRNDQPSQFSSPTPAGQSYNANSPPIETSVSLTTSEPFSYNPSSFGGDSRNTPSNTYGSPNSDNLSNTKIPPSAGGNTFNSPTDFNRGNPTRNQQSTGGNNGYSYQQPNAQFSQPNTLGAGGAPSGAQNYQSTSPVNAPQSNSFGPVGVSSGGQNYQSVGPTNSPSGISSSYFNSQQPPSLSPTYGPPSNTSGGFGGNRGSPQSSFNLLDRKPTVSSSNTLSSSFRPSPNNQIPISGAPQGSLQNLPGLSTNYGSPSTAGGSFNNFPPFGGSFNPSSSPFGSSSTPLNSNRNQYSSFGPTNIPNGRPPSNFGPPNAPQSLYGPPTLNSFPNNGNLLGGRPSNNFIGSGPSQSLYGSPIPSVPTPGNSFASQGNRNKGPFEPPSPTYGPPANSPPFGGTAQSSRPQEFERLNQNTRPFDNSGSGFQNNSTPQRPSPSPLYGTPFPSTPNVGYNQGPTQQGSYSSSQGPASSISPGTPFSNTPNLSYSQGPTQEGPYSSSQGPSSSISPGTPFSNTPNLGYSQGPIQEGPYSSSKSPSSSISTASNSYNPAQNQGRPSSPFQSSSNSNPPQTRYPQRIQNQPQGLSSTFGLPPSQGSQSPLDRNRMPYTPPSNLYQPPIRSSEGENSPQSSYLPPSFNTLNNPTGLGSSSNGGYEAPRSPTNAVPSGTPFSINGAYESSRVSTNTIPSGSEFGAGGGYEAPRSPSGTGIGTGGSYEAPRLPSGPGFGTSGGGYEGPKTPTNTVSSSLGFSTNGGGYEGPRSPPNSIPPRSSSSGNSLSPLYGTPSTNSLNPEISSPNQQGYSSGPAGSPGFNSISPTTETPRPANFNSLSPSYGTPTRDYTDAVIGDYNTPTSPDQGNTFSNDANSFQDFSNPNGNTQPSQSPSLDRGTPAQSAYSAFSPEPSSFNEPPSKLYGAPRPSTDFASEGNSPPFAGSSSINSGPQTESNFGTNPASSYLPPNQSPNGAFSTDDIVPSTSYTLPSDQPNSSQPGASNTVKNVNRNVGSDLITGASTSPFLPFKDDLTKPNAAPSRATYEKSQEVTSNDLTFSGYESVKPAKYQFNYDVKGSGPEFSHQETRNGSTTSGSYGVVLPDGRKQVVDYEANQEGFHPKIRYEETPNNSLHQSSPQNNDQNQGYNYSPSNPPTQNFSSPSFPNLSSLSNQGSSSSYPDTQSSYPSRPDYSIGTLANQNSYTSPYDASSSPLGYPANNQGSDSNFNTYSNQGTSPSNPEKPSSSQFDDSNGYDYTPGGNLNNQATSYDSPGYPSAQNGAKPVPFYT